MIRDGTTHDARTTPKIILLRLPPRPNPSKPTTHIFPSASQVDSTQNPLGCRFGSVQFVAVYNIQLFSTKPYGVITEVRRR